MSTLAIFLLTSALLAPWLWLLRDIGRAPLMPDDFDNHGAE